MAIRHFALMAGLLAALSVLAGCGDKKQEATKRRDASPEATAAQGMSSTSQALLDAINTPQFEGGKLTVSVPAIALTLKPGGSAKGDTRIRNEGDTPVTISSIETALRSGDITFTQDGCRAGTVLTPGNACDLFIAFNDSQGSSVQNEILVLSDAKKTPKVSVDFAAKVEQPKVEQPVVEQKAPPVATNNIPYDAIAQINQMRRNSGFDDDGNGQDIQPTSKKVSTEQRYPEDMANWTETSLPVDNKRLITQDTIINAVLSKPYSNIMCDQVQAKTDADTWGADQVPGRDKPLLPHGTVFIGQCNAFTDERSAVVWTRFITPDHISGKIVGTADDAMGQGGIPGNLDRRWFDKYGVPVVFSSIRSALQYVLLRGQDATSSVTNPELGITTSTQTPESQAINTFQGDMNQVLGNIVNDLKDTKEVLSLPAGTRIQISLTQDIYFKDPYTVVSVGDDEYLLPKKKQQPLYRTAPAPLLAGAPNGPVSEPTGAKSITIDGQEYWLTPAAARQDQQGSN